MATLQCLKRALRDHVAAAGSPSEPLSDEQYRAGFDVFLSARGQQAYSEFVVPQLTQILTGLTRSAAQISVLEIGPGPASVLRRLSVHLRRGIGHYTAYEPLGLYATQLEQSIQPTTAGTEPSSFPDLVQHPTIYRQKFTADTETVGRFDLILFCHSMYGLQPKRAVLEQALGMLSERPDSVVAVFHRDEALDLDGFVSRQTAIFPTGRVSVADEDDGRAVDDFARFVAGYDLPDAATGGSSRAAWRQICRRLAEQETQDRARGSGRVLTFAAPDIMLVFGRQATALPALLAGVPLATMTAERPIKNRQARRRHPAAVVRPTTVRQVQQCVQWALDSDTALTVMGGSHSGQCQWSATVAVDMGAFCAVHVLEADGLVVAGAGSVSGDIVRQAMAVGLTVPLGSRPSVGAGLWLQGGIGHLARSRGLSCDSIVGAALVSTASAEVQCLGRVPEAHRPAGAVRPDNEAELLWALRGGGTNVGIVVSTIFQASAAPTFRVHHWVHRLHDDESAETHKTRQTLHDVATVAHGLSRHSSVDAYLFAEAGQLCLGIALFETAVDGNDGSEAVVAGLESRFGPAQFREEKIDAVSVFASEMYMGAMHGGHAGGKTSAFKRCVFLRDLDSPLVADKLVAAVTLRPTPLCYIHLLHGGCDSAIGDVAPDATAFGCRDWSFAAVVTGVWPRDEDGSPAARAAIQWVYDVVGDMLPLGCGIYCADLGPDPRDALLATQAFGPNGPRLAALKQTADPCHVLRHACPLPRPARTRPSSGPLVLLVTGTSGAGKDYCAAVWASVLADACVTRVASISDAIKEEYAAVTGADLLRLQTDRAYKERHRPQLLAFFQDQVRQHPRLPEEHFLRVVRGAAAGTDVLLVTGLRDEAPVASLSPLVADCQLVEVRVVGRPDDNDDDRHDQDSWRPCFVFSNNEDGPDAASAFAQSCLRPLVDPELGRLASMPLVLPDVPRPGIDFVHVLHVAEQPGGLALCARLLHARLLSVVDDAAAAASAAIVSCEAGGFVFASALAVCSGLPLTLVRHAGKLPPPVVSVARPSSHISTAAASESIASGRLEMRTGALSFRRPIVIVDDVLATGRTLCAVLELLRTAGVVRDQGDAVHVLAVAEFPLHGGRQRLRQCGFGRVRVQSLLVYEGA